MLKRTIYGVILAGGRSSRYRGNRFKFLDMYRGMPIILHIVNAIAPVVDQIIVVTGPENDATKRALASKPDIRYVIQEEPLGTGHALLVTREQLEHTAGIILMSYADKPLITRETLSALVEHHIRTNSELTIATAILEGPSSKGRVIRHEGKFVDIVEAKDADETTLAIREVNAGFIVCNTATIYERLLRLDRNNASGEYYLTSVFREFVADDLPVSTFQIPPHESCDINTDRELKELKKTTSRDTADFRR